MYVTLDEAKKHLNIEDFNEDDRYICDLINAGENAVQINIDYPLNKIVQECDGVLPSPLKSAVLLIVGSLYQNREMVGPSNIKQNPNFDYLIDLYKSYYNKEDLKNID